MSDNGVNIISEYDLCFYQKWNKLEHVYGDEHDCKLNNYLSHSNLVYSSLKDNLRSLERSMGDINEFNWKRIILSDFTSDNLKECNSIRIQSSGNSSTSEIKLGFVVKYIFADYVLCKDKTNIIIKFQRKFRDLVRLKKIKANIIHRYWRICSYSPNYKIGRKLILERYDK